MPNFTQINTIIMISLSDDIPKFGRRKSSTYIVSKCSKLIIKQITMT